MHPLAVAVKNIDCQQGLGLFAMDLTFRALPAFVIIASLHRMMKVQTSDK